MNISLIKLSLLTIAVIFLAYLLSLAILYSQLSRYKTFWETQNAQHYPEDSILYIALGDSTAQGIGATSPMRSYPGLISKELSERRGKPVRLINLSKSGAKVKDAIDQQIPAMQSYKPDQNTVITVEIGANDMINFDAAKFEYEMDVFMGKIPKNALISDVPYFGESRFKNKQSNVVKANEIMYKLAAKHGFELVPLHKQMESNGGIKTFAVDWFHPSNTAYRENWSTVFLDRL